MKSRKFVGIVGICLLAMTFLTGAYIRLNQDVTFGTITGTTITASSSFVGDVTGDITGDVTGTSTGAVVATTITASSTLGVTGTSTFNGLLVTAGTETLSGAGAVPITEPMAEVTSTGVNAWTLADGAEGQHIFIVMVADSGDGTLTPANAGGFTDVVFADAGDSIHLMFTNGNWYVMGIGGLATGPVVA